MNFQIQMETPETDQSKQSRILKTLLGNVTIPDFKQYYRSRVIEKLGTNTKTDTLINRIKLRNQMQAHILKAT